MKDAEHASRNACTIKILSDEEDGVCHYKHGGHIKYRKKERLDLRDEMYTDLVVGPSYCCGAPPRETKPLHSSWK